MPIIHFSKGNSVIGVYLCHLFFVCLDWLLIGLLIVKLVLLLIQKSLRTKTIRNSTMSLTTLVLCFFISQICFWDYTYIFHLGKVFYHLVEDIFNLFASMFLTLCPNLLNFCTSSHVSREMSHMASLVYSKIWDFCIFFCIVLYSLHVHNGLLQMSKMSHPFFSFLSNTSCINRLKKSFLSSFSFFFLPYQFPNNSII